jgi:hypothetical protein
MSPNVYPNATIDALSELLSRGVVRHLEQAAKTPISADDSAPPESPESGQNSLELSRTTGLSVLTGLRTRDSERTRG